MALWDWALEAYARPGVAEACLRLQDEHGQNIPFLLWAAWGRTGDPDLLARAADIARRWDALAVAPIRAVRRSLKPAFAGVDDEAREGLRREVTAAELSAERVLLETLEALGAGPVDVEAPQALQAACAAWGNPPPVKALAALAAALG